MEASVSTPEEQSSVAPAEPPTTPTQKDSESLQTADADSSSPPPTTSASAKSPSPGEPAVNGLQPSPNEARRRRQSKDDQLASPALAGKRQRKASTVLEGYTIDKKTSGLIAVPQPAESSDAKAAPPAAPIPGTKGKEFLLSSQEVAQKAKTLPKGYVLEPVQEKAEEALPAKRERKKATVVPEVAKKPESKSKEPKPAKKKQKVAKSAPPIYYLPPPPPGYAPYPYPAYPPAPPPAAAPVAPPAATYPAHGTVDDHLTSILSKRQLLEEQLKALNFQLAQVSHNLETSMAGTISSAPPSSVPSSSSVSASATVAPSAIAPAAHPQPVPVPVHYAPPHYISPPPVRPPTRITFPKKKSRSSYDAYGDDDSAYGSRPRKRKPSYDFEEEFDEEEAAPRPPVRPPIARPSFNHPVWVKESLKILRQVMRQPTAFPFLKPVDPIALGIPDYFVVIKRPMDLGTIQKALENGLYKSADDFADDVRLVWENSVKYNGPSHEVGKMAISLSSFFEARFAASGLGLPKVPSFPTAPAAAPPPAPAAAESAPSIPSSSTSAAVPVVDPDAAIKQELQETVNQLRASMRHVVEEISNLRKQKAALLAAQPSAKKAQRAVKKEEVVKEMNFEEKSQLSSMINELPPESLGRVVQIIHERMPNLAQSSPDEIEINMDDLDNGTLRVLEKYVRQVLSKTKPGLYPPPSTQATASESKMRDRTKKRRLSGEDMDVDIVDEGTPKTYPSVVIEKEGKKAAKDSESSESSSSSESDSDSESESEKKLAAPAPAAGVSENSPAQVSDKSPETQERQEPKPEDTSVSSSPAPEPLPIVAPTTQAPQEVELKNIDSWRVVEESSSAGHAPGNGTKDETWSQFQSRDQLNKQREKERLEQELREKKLREEREAQRRLHEEARLREQTEKEEEEKRKQEEARLAAQKALEAKRELEKRQRQGEGKVDMLGRQMALSEFEQFASSGNLILPGLRLKEDEVKEDKESGEI